MFDEVLGGRVTGGITGEVFKEFRAFKALAVLVDDVPPETSEPIGANGLGLPSVPSEISKIEESCKLRNAGSEKMESSSFILFIFKRIDKKSLPIAEG